MRYRLGPLFEPESSKPIDPHNPFLTEIIMRRNASDLKTSAKLIKDRLKAGRLDPKFAELAERSEKSPIIEMVRQLDEARNLSKAESASEKRWSLNGFSVTEIGRWFSERGDEKQCRAKFKDCKERYPNFVRRVPGKRTYQVDYFALDKIFKLQKINPESMLSKPPSFRHSP